MATHTARLAEDKRLFTRSDEDLRAEASADLHDDSADWSSDPMEILMAKQERKRSELEMYLTAHTH